MDKDYFNMGTYGVPPYYGFENMNTDSTPNRWILTECLIL